MREYAHQPSISDWTRARIVPHVCHCGARLKEARLWTANMREYVCEGNPRHAVIVDIFGTEHPVKPEAVTR